MVLKPLPTHLFARCHEISCFFLDGVPYGCSVFQIDSFFMDTIVEVFILESLGKIDILNNTDVYNILIYTETNVCSYELLSQCPVL